VPGRTGLGCCLPVRRRAVLLRTLALELTVLRLPAMRTVENWWISANVRVRHRCYCSVTQALILFLTRRGLAAGPVTRSGPGLLRLLA
jgi:hypothetical protein